MPERFNCINGWRYDSAGTGLVPGDAGLGVLNPGTDPNPLNIRPTVTFWRTTVKRNARAKATKMWVTITPTGDHVYAPTYSTKAQGSGGSSWTLRPGMFLDYADYLDLCREAKESQPELVVAINALKSIRDGKTIRVGEFCRNVLNGLKYWNRRAAKPKKRKAKR